MINEYKTILGNNKFIYIDIGSRGGLPNEWQNMEDIIDVVLFEPDHVEGKKLKKLSKKNTTVINSAIWNKKGEVRFNVMKNPSYSSILEPDKQQLRGTYYYHRNFYDIDRVTTIKTELLEAILKSNGIEAFDFLKIDVQGGEGIILETITNWDNILGINIEAYANKIYKGGSDIGSTLNKLYNHNLEIFNVETIATSPIVSNENEIIYGNKFLNARPISGYKPRLMVFDLLLLRNRNLISKYKSKAQKMIFLLSVYKYYDHAISLTIDLWNNKIISNDEKEMIVNSIIKLHKKNLGKYRLLKERVKLLFYNIKKR
tara:strand:+ start:924 stop:1868 length:945 start_codon:yes stop_codon:yes gene_type:complete